MPAQPTLVTLSDPRFTDLVLYEKIEGGSYFSRDQVTVTATAGGTFKQGAVVFRAKGTSASAAWDLVDAAGDLAITNDYAVLMGDDFEPSETITLVTATPKTCLAIVRQARLKSAALKTGVVSAFAGASDTNIADLGRLLATNQVLVDGSLTPIAP